MYFYPPLGVFSRFAGLKIMKHIQLNSSDHPDSESVIGFKLFLVVLTNEAFEVVKKSPFLVEKISEILSKRQVGP